MRISLLNEGNVETCVLLVRESICDDEMMIKFAGTSSDEEVSAMANQLAYENSAYIKRIASKKLAEIDEYVSNYIILIEQAERETFAE